ncbi:MAG: sulfatase [Bryobacterales bacterium]|nr:sulfatase [Bryobacterales bacterium]
MTRRTLLLGALASAPRPNVVYIITDDQRWDLLSLRGHPYIRTPNMDRIGREGITFLNAFVTTSLCSPSRATYLTGRYAHQHLVRYNRVSDTFDRDEVLFPQVLKNAGYRTGYIGKWHIGNNAAPRKGFDYWSVLPGQGRYRDPIFNVQGKEQTRKGHVDPVTADFAVDFIRNQSATQPFCLCVGIKSPHAEQLPPGDMKQLLANVDIPRPATWNEEYDKTGKADVIAQSCIEADRFFDGPRQLKGSWQAYVKDFYRSVMSADRTVGRILDALEEKKLTQDTLVIFVGDNGFFLGEHRLVDKRFPYEEALRVPMLMRYPRLIPPGTVSTQIVLNLDIFSTVLDVCGAKGGNPSPTARSLRPLFNGTAPKQWRTDMFYEYAERIWQCPALVAVRTDRYKYIEYLDKASTNELYDLLIDPSEMRNVIADAGYRATLKDMQSRLARLKKETAWQAPGISQPNSPCPTRKEIVQ